MAMMMTGRVLLVCALCVLWCGFSGIAADGAGGVPDGSAGECLFSRWRAQLRRECAEVSRRTGGRANASAVEECMRRRMDGVLAVVDGRRRWRRQRPAVAAAAENADELGTENTSSERNVLSGGNGSGSEDAHVRGGDLHSESRDGVVRPEGATSEELNVNSNSHTEALPTKEIRQVIPESISPVSLPDSKEVEEDTASKDDKTQEILVTGEQQALQSSSSLGGNSPASDQGAELTAAENPQNGKKGEAEKEKNLSDKNVPTGSDPSATNSNDNAPTKLQAETTLPSPPNANFSAKHHTDEGAAKTILDAIPLSGAAVTEENPTLRHTTDRPIQTTQVEATFAKPENNAAPRDSNSSSQISKGASSTSNESVTQNAVDKEVETTPDGTNNTASETNNSTKAPDNATNKINTVTLTDGDSSTAASHTTSPLLLVVVACAAAAAVVAA
ncbi:Mucin-associated surface protein (MASP) [Trypanosoma cruzi]|uniref:Mucin-associated surface protein (MASP), putative n=2 Tax=Trypanosoma cruzi TaxID=5693 RepID=Q4E5U9_TRYCC|nr:mucin-associated surface protein (MASP), putative [Trypanosoma cruzi]EAO00164.1 mucin-associated surface protein (MASP), putative [Trypanosoma cruzi]PWV21242.1 Mucin-associated surface protein (MASP) [Trypanosoma cruzi]|eukprot:XP_822015.1 mucin-associated surface protein (MASP) [Trypanosoma cruzi strain CL Brener]